MNEIFLSFNNFKIGYIIWKFYLSTLVYSAYL